MMRKEKLRASREMRNKMTNDVAGIGEVLIDFSPIGKGLSGNPAYEMNPGGAIANVLAAYCALGGSAAFIGAVGKDFFAEFLEEKLNSRGIDTSGLIKISDAHTTLAYIFLNSDLQPSYHFMRENGADAKLERAMINLNAIDQARALHFGGFSLSKEPQCDAVMFAAKYAKKKGKLVTFDANYRDSVWKDEETAVKRFKSATDLADIVKLSQDEALMITGKTDAEAAAKEVFSSGKKAVFVTLGKRGVYFKCKDECGLVEAYDVEVKDTTGCGDAFMGAVLYQLLNEPAKMAHEIIKFASAVSALCATKFGAMPAMSSRNEVIDFLMGENDL